MHKLYAEVLMPKDKKTEIDTKYAHNPRYCMILPDAADEWEEDIVSTGQS